MSDSLNGKLGNLVAAGGGKIHTGPFGSQLHASDYVPKGIPCIMPANMKNNRVDLSNIAFITELDAKRLSKYIVKENDIVYSRRGDVTQKALIRKHEEGYFCGTGCLLLRPGKKFDARFLTYYLSTQKIQNWIVSQAVGATMPNLNTGILSSIPFHGPEKAKQKRVANVLSAIEEKIELNNRTNTELEAMAKTLYDYWFVQFDFPDANGKPYKTSGGKMVYNPILKREIPEGWSDGTLGEIADLYQPRTISEKEMKEDGEYLVYGANGIVGHYDQYNHEQSVIAVTCRGNSCGEINVTRPYSWITGNAMVVKTDSHFLPPTYIYNLLRSSGLENVITGSAQPQITRTNLAPMKIIRPAENIQTSYAEFVKPNFEKRIAILDENEKLEKIRDWLLPMLMNGQVTVK